MKFTINKTVCENNNLSVEEALMLAIFVLDQNADLEQIKNNLIKKQVASKDLFNTNRLVLGSKTHELLQKIIVDSDSYVQNNNERIENLPKKLREIYIPGKKEGTQDYFRGTVPEITQKLKKFFIDYGDFTDEQVINATKKYVESFNGVYNYAQLLKYFISKKVDGEKGSRLLNYIVNEDTTSLNNFSEMRYE